MAAGGSLPITPCPLRVKYASRSFAHPCLVHYTLRFAGALSDYICLDLSGHCWAVLQPHTDAGQLNPTSYTSMKSSYMEGRTYR